MANDARAFVTTSPEATEDLGAALGRLLGDRTLVALDGELGAGKTCFVRGLARGLDVQEPVSSPTYALLQSYPGRHELHHLDAWMEGRERSFLLDGGLEWVASHGVTVIEWAERVGDVLPTPRLSVRLEPHAEPRHESRPGARPGADDERLVTLSVVGAGPQGARLSRVVRDLVPPSGARELVPRSPGTRP